MRIKNLFDSLNAQQRSVPQLPAMAKARHISVLGSKTDPKHPFAGYAVGADESAESGKKSIGPDRNDPYEQGWHATADAHNPYAAGTPEHAKWQDGRNERAAQPDHYDESIDNSMPDLEEVGEPVRSIIDAERRMAAGDRIFVAHEMDDEPFEIFNVGDLAGYTYDQILAVPQDLAEACWKGYHKEGNKELFGKRVPNCVKNESAERNELDNPKIQAALKKMAERHKGENWSKEQLAALGKRIAARGQNNKNVKETTTHKGGQVTKTATGIRHQAAPGNYGGYKADKDPLTSLDKGTTNRIERELGIKFNRKKDWQGGIELDEAVTKEDVISKLKAKLGDYLSDLSKEIKSDPDLVDKLAAKPAGDQIGPPVKTITTDDGHEIQIHGNEDDGFRISIKNKQAAAQFKNLDEAVMACEMYCARRRGQQLNADYVEEAGKDACYHKVKSRYKIWPSAYASGALVRCRKVGADNWGNKSKK